METILEAKGISKYFHIPDEVQVLDNVSFSMNKGEFVSIMGKSGCGKSTLLYILSTMDSDYTGELYIDQKLITGQSPNQLANIRNGKIGFVFQFHYLLPEFSVLDNVMLPAKKLGLKSNQEIENDAMEKLKLLGISDQAMKLSYRISGGQKQRVSIARALINSPTIIMGDEPTGNLDSKNSDVVFDIFKDLTSKDNLSLLIVTHDQDFANRTDRIIQMGDGRIIK
ncbi:MAG: ABC transporter ATP-binding protein [Crocinitomicaceae bacterium]|jgi:lipoprotein-releasing system ATP-binding protein